MPTPENRGATSRPKQDGENIYDQYWRESPTPANTLMQLMVCGKV
jgi:hypothetical protein